jgi:prepilin-type N-terminal cleavage/methylation domain-containing protein
MDCSVPVDWPRQRRRGFTLIELLVVMGVIAVLAMILLPVTLLARRHARDASCRSNFRQLWYCVTQYANNQNDLVPANLDTPLRISNVVYKNQRATGWGLLYPIFLNVPELLFCPSDPARHVGWTYGWRNWGTADGEVQCSYGYRGGQNLVPDEKTPVTLSVIDAYPHRVFGAEYYEPFASPARIHHPDHINFLRCNGQVEHSLEIVSFGPTDGDFQAALDTLDR